METRSLTGGGVDMAAGIRVGVTVGEGLAAGFAAVATVERGMGVDAGLGVGLGIQVGHMVGVGSGVELGVAVAVATMVGVGSGVKVGVVVAVGAISTTAAVDDSVGIRDGVGGCHWRNLRFLDYPLNQRFHFGLCALLFSGSLDGGQHFRNDRCDVRFSQVG